MHQSLPGFVYHYSTSDSTKRLIISDPAFLIFDPPSQAIYLHTLQINTIHAIILRYCKIICCANNFLQAHFFYRFSNEPPNKLFRLKKMKATATTSISRVRQLPGLLSPVAQQTVLAAFNRACPTLAPLGFGHTFGTQAGNFQAANWQQISIIRGGLPQLR